MAGVSYRTARDGTLEASTDGGATWFTYTSPSGTYQTIIASGGTTKFDPKLTTATGGPGRSCTVKPIDPFGDAVRAAQTREEAVIPHPVQRVETEAEKDELWRNVVECARGG